MKTSAFNRISRLEIKNADSINAMAEAERKKKLEALEKWREENSNRLAWELFALVIGPKLEHLDNYNVHEDQSEGDRAFCEAHQAFFAMVDRVLKHGFNEEGFLNLTKMNAEERAFAVCLEDLFNRYDTEDGWLLNRAITAQMIALGLGMAHHNSEMSTAEVVQKIDEWRGGPEWRQVAATNADQEKLESLFDIQTITEIPAPGREWVDPGAGIDVH